MGFASCFGEDVQQTTARVDWRAELSLIVSFQLKDLEILPKRITPEVGVGLGAGTLADCIITGTLVYYLRKHKSGFNKCVSLEIMTPHVFLIFPLVGMSRKDVSYASALAYLRDRLPIALTL